MLYWITFFTFVVVASFISLIPATFSLWSLLLQSEFIVMGLFVLFCSGGVFFNLSYLIGLAFILLLLSGLEVSVGFLLLAM